MLFSRFIIDNLSGLYLSPDMQFTETVNLILPFPIGENGHVKTGNPPHGGEYLAADDALYQHGFCPFLFSHQPQLVTVLEAWGKMVRKGKWNVGAEGAVDDWRRATTEQGHLNYAVGPYFEGT